MMNWLNKMEDPEKATSQLIGVSRTPIYQMKYSDGSNSYYIKREDLLPFSFGGNKARKALLFFEDIKRQGSDCVVTYGSSSSNHCRIIANMAASRKLPCYIISPKDSAQPTSNSRIIGLLGAVVIQCSLEEVSKTINKKLKELKAEGKNPYFIQGGGHGSIGTQAYVEAYEEIVEQEKAQGIYFDYIFHASGTGTTQAGLICGKIIHCHTREIIGISNARRNPPGRECVLGSVNEYLESIGRECVTAKAVDFIDDYVLDGYGSYNDEILKTIQQVLKLEGIPLDAVYTGKAFYGMKEYIKKNQIRDENILFIHTGGTPLFFDVMSKLGGGED
jgi:D-cysteine desulfhydrase